ncbi:MAG: cupredoxin domain-containing protein [Solirubrobacteraceae bacterium]|nr:cupredoxin domain-containing protein [Solirubrobacteraceae bacterium]
MSASPPLRLASAAVAIAAVALTACGDSDSSSGSSSSGGGYGAPATTKTTATTSASSSLALVADPSGALKFDMSTLTAKAGTVTLTMKNPSSSGIPHAVAVEGNGVDKDGETVEPGGTSTVKVTLKPGTYTFYCPVPGHEDGGMKGTLNVS